MDISIYAPFFHDGTVYDIQHSSNTMVVSMSSAEMDNNDMTEDTDLSKDNSIQGKLHIEGIHCIKVNDTFFTGQIKKDHDYCKIFDLEIGNQEVEMSIIWRNSPPNLEEEDFSTITIQAEKVWWENIPNLEDDYSD
ncbi:MAG: hypothetical protein P0S94_01040 [Simkaniaceae bacterium]|nr:hypothetical protein [Simkaniaceae bacterium]